MLRTGGFPLELQARKTAGEFLGKSNDRQVEETSKHLVYRDNSGVLREFDWFVNLKRCVETPYVRFNLDFRVIIECKQKERVDWFAFEVPKGAWNILHRSYPADLVKCVIRA